MISAEEQNLDLSMFLFKINFNKDNLISVLLEETTIGKIYF